MVSLKIPCPHILSKAGFAAFNKNDNIAKTNIIRINSTTKRKSKFLKDGIAFAPIPALRIVPPRPAHVFVWKFDPELFEIIPQAIETVPALIRIAHIKRLKNISPEVLLKFNVFHSQIHA